MQSIYLEYASVTLTHQKHHGNLSGSCFAEKIKNKLILLCTFTHYM